MKKTRVGNPIKTGFSFAGCSGTEYNIMERLTDKGYKVLFCDAPYFWSMCNFDTFKIYTYCEGDTSLIECPQQEELIKELKSMIDYYDEEKQAEIKYCCEKNKLVIK